MGVYLIIFKKISLLPKVYLLGGIIKCNYLLDKISADFLKLFFFIGRLYFLCFVGWFKLGAMTRVTWAFLFSIFCDGLGPSYIYYAPPLPLCRIDEELKII